MKFIYITPFREEDFFSDVKRGMNDAAALLGVTACFTGTHGADYDALAAMIEAAAEQGYDGIAVSMPRSGELDAAVHRVREKGTPVISFNIDNPSSARMACVCQDFYRAGMRLGELVYDRLPRGAHVLITMHDAGVSALDERAQGIIDAISSKRSDLQFKSIVSGNTPELARTTIAAELESDFKPAAILCTGQSDTHGAGSACFSRKDVLIAGFDVCDEILRMIDAGIIAFTIDQQPYVQGFYPLLMMVQHITQGIKPFDIDTGCDIIEKPAPACQRQPEQ